MKLVLIPTDTPTEETMHRLERGVEELMDGDCAIVEDGETMTPIVPRLMLRITRRKRDDSRHNRHR